MAALCAGRLAILHVSYRLFGFLHLPRLERLFFDFLSQLGLCNDPIGAAWSEVVFEQLVHWIEGGVGRWIKGGVGNLYGQESQFGCASARKPARPLVACAIISLVVAWSRKVGTHQSVCNAPGSNLSHLSISACFWDMWQRKPRPSTHIGACITTVWGLHALIVALSD